MAALTNGGVAFFLLIGSGEAPMGSDNGQWLWVGG